MADPNPGPPTAVGGLAPVAAALLLFAFALYQALATDHARDLFIYRLGAELAARGENPYDITRIRTRVAAQFPDPDPRPDGFVNNCGYFLPPMAVLVYLPLAALPWPAAKVAWAVAVGLAGYAVARAPGLFPAATAAPSRLLVVVPFLLLLNPLTLVVVVVGQVTLVSVGCVAAGLWALDRGRPYLAAALWALPFVKPHLALPLIPLLWFLAGWRPAAALVLLVAGLNAVGAWVVGGSPLFLREYLDFLPAARDAVMYNRVELNRTITSWNRLLFAAGGPLLELTAVTTVAGYLVWFGLVVGRCAVANGRPSPSWAVAVAAVGAVLCSQVLVYELLILALVVPWVRDLFADGHRLRGWLAVSLLAVQLIPLKAMEGFGVGAHHPLGVALLALVVLTGRTRNDPRG